MAVLSKIRQCQYIPVPHLRIFRHYIHTPILLLSLAEGLLIIAAAYTGFFTRFQTFPPFLAYLAPAFVFAVVLVFAMVAMGVYESRVREGMTGMSLRTAVAIFLLGSVGIAILSFVVPEAALARSVLLFAAIEAFLLITLARWAIFAFVSEESFKKRVLVLGISNRAVKIASRMRRRVDQRAFTLVGFFAPHSGTDEVSIHGANVIRSELTLIEICDAYRVDEIVVAMDERRRDRDAQGGLPLDELMECRLQGIAVCDVQQFIEREACKMDVDLLRPSWLVFSDGFAVGPWRAFSKRSFDILASLALLSIAWPVMLMTILLVRLDSPGSVFYRQQRIGLDGKPFELTKFRSMVTGADDEGWTARNDPRVTRVGRFIRRSRIDELPQLFNVLRGRMSFVGPRPERPAIVEQLKTELPFYDQRHRVKPGITGWAQLCYPYGSSVEDAKEKLQYDLYYLKNNSFLLDLIIMLQTVEVVLVGEGAR